MKKTLAKGLALAFIGSLFVAGSAMALPLGNGPSGITPNPSYDQESLQSIVDNVLGQNVIDVYNDQTGVGGWTQTDGDVTSYKITYALGTNDPDNYIGGILGVYDLSNSSKTYNLLDTNASQTSKSFSINDLGGLKVDGQLIETGWSGSFGFYYIQSGRTLFTEDDKNVNGNNHAATYLIPEGTHFDTTCYLGVAGDSGDLTGNDDWLLAFDWNTNVNDLRDFNDGVFMIEDMKPVPEPATMLLFGTGLAGLATLRRRKANK